MCHIRLHTWETDLAAPDTCCAGFALVPAGCHPLYRTKYYTNSARTTVPLSLHLLQMELGLLGLLALLELLLELLELPLVLLFHCCSGDCVAPSTCDCSHDESRSPSVSEFSRGMPGQVLTSADSFPHHFHFSKSRGSMASQSRSSACAATCMKSCNPWHEEGGLGRPLLVLVVGTGGGMGHKQSRRQSLSGATAVTGHLQHLLR